MGGNKEKNLTSSSKNYLTTNFKIIIMKKTFLNIFIAGSVIIVAASSCSKNDSPAPVAPTVYYQGGDQMGRPAINTVFVNAAAKDSCNNALPTQMAGLFTAKFKAKLLGLNAGYTTNALGLNADAFTGVLVTDVLNVSTTGTTTFFDGTNVLTGRILGDDVIDTELILIFGGPNGTANPGLTSDNVSANDKAFLTTFPYLASPW